MGLSIFLAKLLGLYMLIVAVIWAARKKQMQTLIKDLISKPSLLMFSGFFALVSGLAIAIGHPILELNWRGLITLIGYLAILQGIMRIAFPNEVKNYIEMVSGNRGYWIMFSIMIILGLVLTYFGFSGEEKKGLWFWNHI